MLGIFFLMFLHYKLHHTMIWYLKITLSLLELKNKMDVVLDLSKVKTIKSSLPLNLEEQVFVGFLH